MIKEPNKIQQKPKYFGSLELEEIAEAIVLNHNLLSKNEPTNPLLKMAIVLDNNLLGFKPEFDQKYREQDLLKKYGAYLDSLKSATEKYFS